MELIQKLLNTEELSYSSNLTAENLKKRIEDLFEQSTLRLAGKLTSDHEFTAYDKLVVVGWDVPNLRRKSAYIKGTITPAEKGSLIKLKVKPNSVLPIFAILAALSGAIISLLVLSGSGNDKSLLLFGLFLLLLGIVYYPVSTLLRNRLRNKVVKYLDLSRT